MATKGYVGHAVMLQDTGPEKYQGLPVGKPPELSPVDVQLSELEGCANNLRDQLGMFEERIGSILSPMATADFAGSLEKARPQCALANRIEVITAIVRHSQEIVSRMGSGLEL